MSTPEDDLGTTLWKKVTFSNFFTLAEIGLKIFDKIETDKRWANLNAKLDQIQRFQQVIKERVDHVYAEVLEAKLRDATKARLEKIDTWQRDFLELLTDALRGDIAQTDLARRANSLAEDLSNDKDGVGKQLRELHAVFMGTEVAVLDREPYMSVFVREVLQNSPAGKQSPYFHAITRFERFLQIQRTGLLLLANAQKHQNPKATVEDILKSLRKHSHDRVGAADISRFKLQADKSARFLAELPKTCENANAGSDYIAFGISTCNSLDVFYVDTNEVVADSGKVVVGLQLYGSGDRLALRILQAPFAKGLVDQEEEPTAKSSEMNNNFSEMIDKERVKALIREYGQHRSDKDVIERGMRLYVNLSTAEAPRREIVTGAKLYMRGQWLCIGIQAAKLNDKWTEVDEGSRHWIDAPEPRGDGVEEKDYYSIRGTAKYINTQALIPRPYAPIRAVKFWRHATGDDHRLNLSIKTGLCDIEDVWEKYEISKCAAELLGSAKLLVNRYAGRVFLTDSQGLHINASKKTRFMPTRSELKFDLVQDGPWKIGFRGPTGLFLHLGPNFFGKKDFLQLGSDTSQARFFEWELTSNGAFVLKGSNGKFLRRIDSYTPLPGCRYVADQDSPENAEPFQMVATA